MGPRILTAALLLAVCAFAVMADDCEICSSSNPSDCDSGGVATLSGSPTYIQNKSPPVQTCADAYKYVTCGQCKQLNPRRGTAGDCCTLFCKKDGKGNIKAHCVCGPPADNAGEVHDGDLTQVGVCADPQAADRVFNLITDQGLSMNAHFIGPDGLETGFDGTWISALGFLWTESDAVRSATFTVKEGSAAFTDAIPFAIEIDGQELPAITAIHGQDAVLFQDSGITIAVAPFAYALRVTIKDHLTIIVTAATHEHPAGNHIDIGISKLNVTATVHGALGQTFAAARAEALKAGLPDDTLAA